MEIIIAAAVHRSGSTLLQRIFNSRKESLVWGEHHGIVNDFMEIYKKVRNYSMDVRQERSRYFESGEDPNTWIATMTPEFEYAERAIVRSVRGFLDTLYDQHRDTHDLVGFKEVNYGEPQLRMLRKCYPDAAFLLVVRNPIHTWESLMNCRGWYKDDVRKTADKWNRNVGGYMSFVQSDPNAYLIRYEDLIRQTPAVMRILTKVARIPEEMVLNVLGNKIGSTAGSTISEEDQAVILDICGVHMEQLGYGDSEGREEFDEFDVYRTAFEQD